MTTAAIIIAVLALIAGIWVGLGHPGLGGREDRIVKGGTAQRLPRKRIDWLRPPERDRERRRR